MPKFDPTGVIIDGAVPRNHRERAARLIDYGFTVIDHLPPDVDKVPLYDDLVTLSREADGDAIDPNDGMIEVEEQIIAKLTEVLGHFPGEWEVHVGQPDPGDVIITTPELDGGMGQFDPRVLRGGL
jgi:hypothetical protein